MNALLDWGRSEELSKRHAGAAGWPLSGPAMTVWGSQFPAKSARALAGKSARKKRSQRARLTDFSPVPGGAAELRAPLTCLGQRRW
jgi:hypothetical protein